MQAFEKVDELVKYQPILIGCYFTKPWTQILNFPPSISVTFSEDTGEETTPPVTTQQRDPASRASPTADVGKLCSGRCKWFDVSKGYGFITTDDNSGDVFVYQVKY